MTLPLLLALSISTSALPAPTASPAAGESFLARTTGARKATLLGGRALAAAGQPVVSPPLRPVAGVRFNQEGVPGPLDEGGGAGLDSGTRQIAALLLGLIVGFGTGHLVARDRNGFILFLIVDVAIVVVFSVLAVATWGGFFGIEGLGLLVSHIVQGLDAYGKAGGERLIQLDRERSIRLASVGSGLEGPVITSRACAFSF